MVARESVRRRREISGAGVPGNQILAGLPHETYLCVASDLEPVHLAAGSVVTENNARTRHAYFPLDCVVSLQGMTREGASVEFGLIGSEGVLGLAAIFEGESAHGRAVVQTAGHALRLPVQALMNSCRRCSGFHSGLLRFSGVFGAQVAQRSICHRVHSIEQHLCSWLLLMHDRSFGEAIEVTHDALGGVLGARREGVSIAVKRLREAGLIRTVRGRLVIRDHAALVEHSCECYGVIRQAYDGRTWSEGIRLWPGLVLRREKSI